MPFLVLIYSATCLVVVSILNRQFMNTQNTIKRVAPVLGAFSFVFVGGHLAVPQLSMKVGCALFIGRILLKNEKTTRGEIE